MNTLETLTNLMNDPQFRDFFDRHFNDYTDVQSTLLLMKTYQYIEQLYIRKKGVKPTGAFMRKGIQRLFADNTVRPMLVESMAAFASSMKTFSAILDQRMVDYAPRLEIDLLE